MAVLERISQPFTERTEPGLSRARPPRPAFSPWTLRTVADAAALFGAAAVVGTGGVHLAYLVVSAAALALTGTYRRRISLSVLDEAPRLLIPLAAALMIVGSSAVVIDVPSSV